MADKQVYQSGQLTLQTPEKGAGTEGLFMELFGNLSVQGDVFIQGDTIQVDDVVSFSVADAFTVLNFGETGSGVVSTETNNRSGLIIDRGLYSLIDDPNNPGNIIVEREGGEPDGAPVYRDDPAAQSIIDTSGSPAPAGSYAANPVATMSWDENIFGWDLNSQLANRKDQAGDDLPVLTLPQNPRILNLGNPNDDTDKTVATNVGYVLDKDEIIQTDLDSLREYLNTDTAKTNNHIMYWNSTTSSWDARIMDITLDTAPVLGGDLDVSDKEITSSIPDGDIVINPDGSGAVVINKTGSGTVVTDDGSNLLFSSGSGSMLFNSNATGAPDTSITMTFGNNSATISTNTSKDLALNPDGELILKGMTFPDTIPPIVPPADGSGYMLVTNGTGIEFEYIKLDDLGGSSDVVSVFGRKGIISSVLGDYTSDQIMNNSSVTGTVVSDALNTLSSSKANKTSLSSVATSGNYNDLNNKPDIASPTDSVNVGTGEGSVYRDKTDDTLNFRKLKAGANITISNVGSDVVITGADAASSPVTSVTGGTGLTQASTIGDVLLNVGAGTGITVDANNVSFSTSFGDGRYLGLTAKSSDSALLDGMSSASFAKTATSIVAGNGLTGGGTLASNRTFDVGSGTGISVTSNTVELDITNSRNISHSSVLITAGDGLTGGGAINASRTITVDSTVARTNLTSAQTFSGSITAPSFNTNSAMKYKEEIMPFENALEKIMMIDVFTYRSKSDNTKKRQLGVSAESMAKVAPELVAFKDGEPDAVNYAQGFALLVQAMQEREQNTLINKIKRMFTNFLSIFKENK